MIPMIPDLPEGMTDEEIKMAGTGAAGIWIQAWYSELARGKFMKNYSREQQIIFSDGFVAGLHQVAFAISDMNLKEEK